MDKMVKKSILITLAILFFYIIAWANTKEVVVVPNSFCYNVSGYCTPKSIGCADNYYMFGDTQMGCEEAGLYIKSKNPLEPYWCCIPINKSKNITIEKSFGYY